MSSPRAVTDATFKRDVLQASGPVLVDFWAPWCAPCRALAPILDKLAAEQEGTLTVAKLNVDENGDAPARYGVRGIPTLILFRDGQPVTTMTGPRTRAAILQQIGPHLQAS